MDKIIIAIDPGAAGGIIIANNTEVLSYQKMPSTDDDVVEVIRKAYREHKVTNSEIVCVYEKVSGYAGGEGNPGSAMFNFGDGFGVIKGALIAFKIRRIELTPQKWQKGLSLGNKQHAKLTMPKPERESYNTTKEYKDAFELYKVEKKRVSVLNSRYKTEWKNKLKDEAQKLFPNIKMTLNISDALLILEYYKRFLNK